MTSSNNEDLIGVYSPANAVQDLADEPEIYDDLLRTDATRIVHRLVTDSMEPAIRCIINLSATGSNERLRFDAAKYILELGLPVGGNGDPESPIEKLIGEIQEAGEQTAL